MLMTNTPLVQFSLHYTELLDLDEADPLRPIAAIHVEGPAASAIFNAVGQHFPTYVVGRGALPQSKGYSLLVSQGDYPALRCFLAGSWPEMPPSFPPRAPLGGQGAYTQETCDVINYLAKPPRRDFPFQARAQKTLATYVPPATLPAALYLCQWLRENLVLPNDPYTVAVLLARGLQALGLPAQFQTGALQASLKGEPQSITRAWVTLDGRILDLTLDQPGAWQGAPSSLNLLDVMAPQVQYASVAQEQADKVLAHQWFAYSKPLDRPTYSAVSLRQQSRVMQKLMGGKLYAQRQGWLTSVRATGMLEGTQQWVLTQMAQAAG